MHEGLHPGCRKLAPIQRSIDDHQPRNRQCSPLVSEGPPFQRKINERRAPFDFNSSAPIDFIAARLSNICLATGYSSPASPASAHATSAHQDTNTESIGNK